MPVRLVNYNLNSDITLNSLNHKRPVRLVQISIAMVTFAALYTQS